MPRTLWLAAALICTASLAHAETDRQKAEREVEQEMQKLVKAPPAPHVSVIWEGSSSDAVALDEARFELDDAVLSYGDLDALQADAKHGRPLYEGPLDAGKHTLRVHLVVHRTKLSLFEGLRRTTYKITSAAGFPGQPGLAITVRIKLDYDAAQDDVKKRMRLRTQVVPKMMVALDDGSLPAMPRSTALAPSTVEATATAEPEPDARSPREPKPVASARPKVEAAPDATPAQPVKVAVATADTSPVPPPAHRSSHRGSSHSAPAQLARATPAPTPRAEARPAGEVDAGAPDAGEVGDAGSIDAGLDAGSLDGGSLDAGSAAAAVDAGAPAPVPAAGMPNYVWAVIVGLGVFALLLVAGLKKRKKA